MLQAGQTCILSQITTTDCAIASTNGCMGNLLTCFVHGILFVSTNMHHCGQSVEQSSSSERTGPCLWSILRGFLSSIDRDAVSQMPQCDARDEMPLQKVSTFHKWLTDRKEAETLRSLLKAVRSMRQMTFPP